jgi:tetratricopeptide (TPR) repeat protein
MSEQKTDGASAGPSGITWPGYWRGLRWVLVFLSLVGALGATVCLFRVVALAGAAWSHATASPATPASPVQQPATPAQQGQSAPVQQPKDYSADFRSSETDHDNLLNRLIALVGLYTIFIGFFTLITGLYSYINVEALKKRTDAQSAELDKDFGSLKETAATLETDLRKSSAKLEAEIRDQLPELGRLKERLREVVQDLDHLIPNEEDWAGGARISGSQREGIRISEMTIAGLRIFLNPTAVEMKQSMSRLYRKLGRFYFDEFVRLNSVEASERADLYLGSAIELDPAAAESYQLRGAIALTRATLSLPDGQGDEEPLGPGRQNILDHAIRNLKRALQLNPDSLGAAYNLALSYFYSGRIDLAVSVSTDARLRVKQALQSTPPTLSSGEVRKYVPYLYTNIVCYLFDQAQNEPAAVQDWPDEALDVLTEGVGLLSRPGYREAFNELRNAMANEIRGGDLREVDADFRRQVNGIFAETQQERPSDGEER